MMQPSPSSRSVNPAACQIAGRDTHVVAVHILGAGAVQDGVQGAAQPRQDPVLADVVHQPDHRHAAGLPGGDGAGDNVGQQLAVLPGRPHIVVEVGIVEIPPPQVPGVLAGGMGRGGHAQGDQVGGRLDFLQPQVPLHGGQRV